jgi:pyruvate formate lyase activating enzyme
MSAALVPVSEPPVRQRSAILRHAHRQKLRLAPAIHTTNSMTEPLRLEGFPGRYWHRLEDGRIQCDVCPRFCRLNEGQRGLCFVRGRQDDRIVLTTYGRSSGFCVDPIEKKPLNHYLPGTPVLSFGTAGCNLTCKFCQNWDISKARELDRLQDAASPEEIVEAAIAVGSRSIAYTYNDPVIFLEYAVDVAKVARRRGIKNVAVTAGYVARGGAGGALLLHGRRQRRPQGVH